MTEKNEFLERLRSTGTEASQRIFDENLEAISQRAVNTANLVKLASVYGEINKRLKTAANFLLEESHEPRFFFGLNGERIGNGFGILGGVKQKIAVKRFKAQAKMGWVLSCAPNMNNDADSRGYGHSMGNIGKGLLTDGTLVSWTDMVYGQELSNILSATVINQPFNEDIRQYRSISPEDWIHEKEEVIAQWTGSVVVGQYKPKVIF